MKDKKAESKRFDLRRFKQIFAVIFQTAIYIKSTYYVTEKNNNILSINPTQYKF